jgi:hypothetical protein
MGTEKLDRNAVGIIEINDGSGWHALGIIREEIVRVNGEEITHFDVSGHPGGIDETVFGNVNVEIEFTWEEIADIGVWAVVLHGGGVTTSDIGIQAVVNEDVIMRGTDWIALSRAADFIFDSAVSVSNPDGSITYIEGGDYYLDRKGGHLRRIAGGSIGEGQEVYVDYRYSTYAGKCFKIFEDSVPTEYVMRLTKPLLNGDNLRITHGRVAFFSPTELPLKPGESGSWAGVTNRIRFLKDSDGIYGMYGLWEIYTPKHSRSLNQLV